jgi:hypothetical protein
MSEHREYFTWGGNTLIFGDRDGYKWETTYRIVQDAASAVDMAGGLSIDALEQIEKKLPKKDVKQFIKIVCEVNGKIYTETRHKQTAKKITVGDIQRTFDKYNIKIEVKDN